MKEFKDFSLKMLVGLFAILGGVLILLGIKNLLSYFDLSLFPVTLTTLIVISSFVFGSYIVERFKDKEEWPTRF